MKCTFIVSIFHVPGFLLVMFCIRLCDSFTATPFPCRSILQNRADCRLYRYKPKDLVECFDNIISASQKLQNRPLHFAFVGDSRMRQEFHSFWPNIPNYDLKWYFIEPVNRLWLRYHNDVILDSNLLNTRISYRWLSEINDAVLDLLKNWSNETSIRTPFVLFLGFATHHMNETRGSQIEYENRLKRLEPVVRQLSRKSHIIWFSQTPIIQTCCTPLDSDAMYSPTTQDKIDHYNDIARQLLKDSGILFWDSMKQLAEEYVRSCFLLERSDRFSYYACHDFIHNGYIVIDLGMQLIFNTMCNHYFFDNI